MRRGCYTLFGMMIGSMLLAGCTNSMTGRVEMDYGTSYQLAKHNQILHLEAEKNLDPVYGFEGGAAQATLDKYEKSFARETAAPLYSINVGAGLK